MELLDRYLQAVRFWLPRAQQDDIIAELGDDLRSQIEDRQSSLGRPLNEEEMVTLLHQTGHPMRVAGRYLPQQSLIGPVLFPLYRFVVMVVAFGYLAPWLLVWVGMMIFMPSYRASHTGMAMLETWASFWNLAFMLFGAITITFAIMDRFQARITWLNQWDPRKLPRVARRKDRVSRIESVFSLVFSISFVIWWLALPRYGHMMFGPVAGFFWLNPALRVWFFPAVVPTCVLIVQQCINLFRPEWTWFRAAAMLLADVITLGIVAFVARIHPFVFLADTGKDAAQRAQAFLIVNQVIQWSLIAAGVGVSIALIVHAYQTVRELRRMAKGQRNGTALQLSQTL